MNRDPNYNQQPLEIEHLESCVGGGEPFHPLRTRAYFSTDTGNGWYLSRRYDSDPQKPVALDVFTIPGRVSAYTRLR